MMRLNFSKMKQREIQVFSVEIIRETPENYALKSGKHGINIPEKGLLKRHSLGNGLLKVQ